MHSTSRWPIVLGAAAIVLCTVVAYAPAFNAGFIWDDDEYVENNPTLRDASGLGIIWLPWTASDPIFPVTSQYYPLVYTSFWIEYHLWGLEPQGYHAVNILLHAVNALLVWLIFTQLRIPGGAAAAWLIAALFAVHPIHVESVAWITERKNLLSGLFYLSAAATYLRFDQIRSEHDAAWRTCVGWYGASLALFIGAMLSKTVACSLPAALILAMLWLRRPISIRRLLPLLPMFIIGLGLALQTALLERTQVGAVGVEFDHTFLERLLIASRALLFYPLKLLLPWPLMFVYPRWDIDTGAIINYLPLLIVIAAFAIGMALYIKGRRGVFLALAFYAGTIFPAIGFFNVYPHRFSFVADHFVYLASLGIIALFVAALVLVMRCSKRAAAFGSVLVVILILLTFRQSIVYADAETVWRDTLSKNDEAWMPHNNLAGILLQRAEVARQRGEEPRVLQLAEEAEHHARRALDIKADHHPAMSNLSEALRLQGEYDEAIALMQRAIDEADFIADYHHRLGRLHHLAGQPDLAEPSYRKALEFAPQNLLARSNLAALLASQGRLDEAAKQHEALIAQTPNETSIEFLADYYRNRARYPDAAQLYAFIIEHSSEPLKQIRAMDRLARMLATAPDDSFRDGEQAVRLAQQVCQMTNWQLAFPLDTLAAAYAEQGDFEEAVRTSQRALRIAQEQGMNELATQLEQRIRLYESGNPYREQPEQR